MTTINTTVYSLERVRNSVNGNPRYRVHTAAGTFLTSSDHGFVYAIENGWRGRDTRDAVLTLTRAGRISDLEYVN